MDFIRPPFHKATPVLGDPSSRVFGKRQVAEPWRGRPGYLAAVAPLRAIACQVSFTSCLGLGVLRNTPDTLKLRGLNCDPPGMYQNKTYQAPRLGSSQLATITFDTQEIRWAQIQAGKRDEFAISLQIPDMGALV